MSIKKYENEAEKVLQGVIDDAETKLIKEYKIALDNIKLELSNLYEKYSVDGKLTLSQMTQANRLNQLYDFLDRELTALGVKQETYTKVLVGEMYSESFYRYGYSIEAGAGLHVNYGLVNRESILALIKQPGVSGKSLERILGEARFKLLVEQRAVITQGFIQGKSAVDMAIQLSNSMNISMNRALLIVRTEGTRSQSQGQIDAYSTAKDEGTELVRIWMTAGGAKEPRHDGTPLDEQREDRFGYFHRYGGESEPKAQAPAMFGVAKEDCNCRCTTRAEIKGFPADMPVIPEGDRPTYEDWLKAQQLQDYAGINA